MNPEWLDVTVKVLVPLMSGGVVGAFIGAQLTTRRERWNLRRQLYADLLGELVELESRVHDLENSLGPPRLADVSSRVDLLLTSVLRAKRALAVAKIVITPGIAKVIDEEIGPAGSVMLTSGQSSADHLSRFRVVLRAAVKDLQEDARTDLLGGSGWIPPESWRGRDDPRRTR